MTTFTTIATFNVLALFVHDRYDAGTLDESTLAGALTAYLHEAVKGGEDWYELQQKLEVRHPEETMLSRFTLRGFSERCHNWGEVKALWANGGLPGVVATALERLQRSKARWELLGGREPRLRRKRR